MRPPTDRPAGSPWKPSDATSGILLPGPADANTRLFPVATRAVPARL